MLSLPIHSRAGNWILLLLGVVFVVASASLLALSVSSTWGYAGLIDHLAQTFLIGTAIAGALLVVGARANLHGRSGHTNASHDHAHAR